MVCCSASDFTTASDADIDPSQRVNYGFGMVLGVDDFKQEHAWLAARDKRALRETIGYGAVAGLEVTVGEPAGAVEIRVSPGLAVAPSGELIAVSRAQCARLDSWLAGPGRQESIEPGSRSVYVALAYTARSGTPVPIPGEPCRDESSLQADSRIADGFTLNLCWQAPSTSEDSALRALVAWLREIEVRDAPTGAVSITEFQDAVEQTIGAALSDPFEPPDKPPTTWGDPARWLVIPRAQYAAYLSAAFDVWVRRLRPLQLSTHGPVQWAEGAGKAEHAVLLAKIDVELDAQGLLVATGDPSARARVDGLGRPQILHLRLLQEWLLSNVENDAPREAHYVLGKGDPRLPGAQDLHETFFGRTLRPEQPRVRGAIARVDEVEGDSARLVPAQLWSGERDERKGRADYYAPHMTAPILVADGGTGQSQRPKPLQVLIGGQPGDVGQDFVLATITAGKHVSIDLQAPQLTGSTEWALVINSEGGIALPLQPEQGGTGLTQIPAQGEMLIGDGSGGYKLQPLRDPVLSGVVDQRIRIIKAQDEVGISDDDQVLVVEAPDIIKLLLPSPPPLAGIPRKVRGRVLTIKSANRKTTGAQVFVSSEDGLNLTLEGDDSVTVIASSQLGRWLVIGRS